MRSSRSVLARSLAVTTVLGLSLVTASPAVASGGSTLLRDGFEGSVPTGPLIDGVAPGGAPWVLDDHSEVRVREDGRIRIRLDDLIVPARGDNPAPMMFASLLCGGRVVDSTPAFAVDVEGDGRFRGEVDVPKKCHDPQVLIRNAGGTQAYFAFTQDKGKHHHH
jgi:hypothetical protein